MWLQEVGDWSIIPDEIMRGTIDRLENLTLGAMNHHGLFQFRHTVCMWWNPHTMSRSMTRLLQEITTKSRPGSNRIAICWTTNPQHTLAVEHPLSVEERTSQEVLSYLHLIHRMVETQPRWKEYTRLSLHRDAILATALESRGPRLLKSLKDADVYRSYGGDCETNSK